MTTTPPSGTPINLTKRERVVLRCAIEYYLENTPEDIKIPGEDVEEVLNTHHTTLEDDTVIEVQPGMDDFYQDIFQSYARELQETIPEEEGTEQMADFFEGAFKGITTKIQNVTEPAF